MGTRADGAPEVKDCPVCGYDPKRDGKQSHLFTWRQFIYLRGFKAGYNYAISRGMLTPPKRGGK